MASLTGAVLLAIVSALPSTTAHVHISTTLSAGGGWLNEFNLWRTTTGLPALSENAVWSDGDYKHSLYMVKNDLVTHYETAGVPYYTPEGDTAARNSNIEVMSSTSTTDEQAIDWWMQAPFHAMGMMDPRLQQTGFGSYREVKTGWQAGFAVDTLRGNSFTGGRYPVYFPGNGSTEPLRTYGGGEFPDPLPACPGYTVPTGLPVFVQVGGNVATTAGPVHSFTGNGAPLAHCVIDSTNPAVGTNLVGRGGVIVIPQQPLQTGVRYVVALTVNGLPYTWSFTVGPFATTPPPTGWQSLGGTLTTSPTASSSAATATDAFVRGTDNGLWHRSWNGTAWSAWDTLGGIVTADPSAVSQGPGHTDVFVRGTDNAIWHRAWNGTAWSAWDSVGGIATSAPHAASWGVNRLDIVVRGTDNGLWHRSWNGTAWGAWDKVGGTATSNPSVVAAGIGRLDVFVRGTDNGLWHRSGDGTGTWGAWESLGKTFINGPDAASCAAGHLDAFVVGNDGGLWQSGFNGTSWSVWKLLGGSWTSSPAAVCRPGTVIIDAFSRGTDNALWTGPATGS